VGEAVRLGVAVLVAVFVMVRVYASAGTTCRQTGRLAPVTLLFNMFVFVLAVPGVDPIT
jgi:hypothetical protein